MSENYPGFIYIPLLGAIAVYLIYVLLSNFLFFMSVRLPPVIPQVLIWSIIYERYYSFILPLLWLILLIAGFFTRGGYISKYYFFGILIAIFIFQILSVLFNYIICSPASSNNVLNYIQKIITEDPSSVFQQDRVISFPVSSPIYNWVRLAYYFCNFILIISLISASKIPL